MTISFSRRTLLHGIGRLVWFGLVWFGLVGWLVGCLVGCKTLAKASDFRPGFPYQNLTYTELTETLGKAT